MKRLVFLLSVLLGLALVAAPIRTARVEAQSFSGQTSPGYVQVGQGSAGLPQWKQITGSCSLTSSGVLACPFYARLFPASGQSSSSTVPWQAVDPFGRAIQITSTNSQGFNEFVAAANTNGWSWKVYGNAALHTTVQLSVPVCFLRHELIDTGVAITVDSSLGASDTLVHDTFEDCDIEFLGTINQHAGDTGYAYSFAPVTADGAGNTGGFASFVKVFAGGPASGGGGTKFSLANGGLIGNDITVADMNGGATGILVTNPGSGFIGYEHNTWHILYNHSQTTRVGQIGTSSSNQANMRFNTYTFGRIDPGSGATAGWDTWETYATYVNLNVSNEIANATTGLVLESGANHNKFIGGSVFGTTVLSNSGSCNTFLGVDNIAGTISSEGATSGCATVAPQTSAGTPSLAWPNTSGTLADGASTPLVLNASTGNLTINTATNTALGAASGDNATLSVNSGAFGLNLSHANTWGAAQTFGTNDAKITLGGSSSTSNPPASLCPSGQSQGNAADAGPDTLLSCSVAASTLDSNNRGIHFEAWGNYAANGNTKTLTITWGGTTVFTSTALAQNGTAWHVGCNVFKRASNSQSVGCDFIAGNNALLAAYATTTITDTNAANFIFQGASGSSVANDIVLQGAYGMVVN